MRLIYIAAFAAVVATPAIAQDMDAFQQAATMLVANERCGDVFPKDIANGLILTTSMKTGTNLYENSEKVSKIADNIRAHLTAERQQEFCDWTKAAAATMGK
jgi:hypothetical protein